MQPPFVGPVHPVFHSHPLYPVDPKAALAAPPEPGALAVHQLTEWRPNEGAAVELVAAFFRDYRGYYYDDMSYWRKVLALSPELCFVAVHDGRILGATLRFTVLVYTAKELYCIYSNVP